MEEELVYTVEVLEEAPTRVTRFLQGLGAVPMIRTLLAGAGMTDEDIAEGRKLLLECLAEPRAAAADLDTNQARAQRAAAAEIDQWDEQGFARYGATLRRDFPSANEYVFGDLKASTGAESVNGVATFLARIDALESGSDPQRAAFKKDDAKAVALLARLGLTKAERQRAEEARRCRARPIAPLEVLPPPDDDARLRKLGALRGWFDEWAETARAVVKKRAYLIRLGLASRKSAKKDEPEERG